VVLIADVIVVSFTAVTYTLLTTILLGLTVGICQSLGKLSLDALIQRDVSEVVRTSVFARSETLLQLSWVIGGFAGLGLALQPPRVGLFVAAAILIGWLTFVVLRNLQPGSPAGDSTSGENTAGENTAGDSTT